MEQYHGVAIHPRHLSWYERVILKRDRFYDPVLDKESKINDLRILYESYLIANASEETVNGSAHENEKSGESRRAAGADEDHAFISEDVARYFESEEPREARVQHASKKEEELASAVPTVSLLPFTCYFRVMTLTPESLRSTTFPSCTRRSKLKSERYTDSLPVPPLHPFLASRKIILYAGISIYRLCSLRESNYLLQPSLATIDSLRAIKT